MVLVLFCDNIPREEDKGNLFGAVYIDLSKAFDTIAGLSADLENLEQS